MYFTNDVALILSVLVFQYQFSNVYNKPEEDQCSIILDGEDKYHKRFLYVSTSDSRKLLRCTYCSAKTRESTQIYLDAREDQCVKNNENIPLKFDLVPRCRHMDPITCIIPNPIENGEWVCPCSGLDNIPSGEVLVYTNCTQQCKPGYILVGESFGHCGERWPIDKRFPTEFRFGNARCAKRESADQQINHILIVVVACVSFCGVCGCIALVFCYCCRCCCFKNCRRKNTEKSVRNRVELKDYKSSTGSSNTGTQVSDSTQTTSLADPLVHVKEDKFQVVQKGAAAYSVQDLDSFQLSEGGPITGLSSSPYNTPIPDKCDVTCDVQLANLSLQQDQCFEFCILNTIDEDRQIPICRMAVDILERNFSGFKQREMEIKSKLKFDCETSTNPAITILTEFLKCYPVNIGHVVQWCEQNGYKSLVPYLVSENHEKACSFCSSSKNRVLKKEQD
ncbi:uncharacterized protein [Argopecten irradians]|uniref:uncharacterized protein isoform X2 n=1 Tax=Argopecten irradians TaxID=31199 RepID=UPI003722F301